MVGDWSELKGLTEAQAEEHMLASWGVIPDDWNNPLFRDEVIGTPGNAELEAHMNFGEQAYGGASRLGDEARGVWDLRNIAGQGHPAEGGWRAGKKS